MIIYNYVSSKMFYSMHDWFLIVYLILNFDYYNILIYIFTNIVEISTFNTYLILTYFTNDPKYTLNINNFAITSLLFLDYYHNVNIGIESIMMYQITTIIINFIDFIVSLNKIYYLTDIPGIID